MNTEPKQILYDSDEAAAEALEAALRDNWPDVWFPRDARPARADLDRVLSQGAR